MKPLKEVMKVIRAKNKGKVARYDYECMYRTRDNNCCLVGAFIPDDKYNRNMESKTATHIIIYYNLEEYMPFDVNIMNNLQNFHDNMSEFLEGEEFYNAVEEWLRSFVYSDLEEFCL